MIKLPFSRKQTPKEEIKRKPPRGEEGRGGKIKRNEPKKKAAKRFIAFRILRAPIISEKGTILEKEGKYVFKVFPTANKNEIKKAIKEIYNVEVKKVNIIKTKPKKRRLGKIKGWKSGYKKAIVTLKEGKKIEVVSR